MTLDHWGFIMMLHMHHPEVFWGLKILEQAWEAVQESLGKSFAGSTCGAWFCDSNDLEFMNRPPHNAVPSCGSITYEPAGSFGDEGCHH